MLARWHERQRTHAPRHGSASGRGVWTLVEASVERRVMSGATAAGAEQRDSAAWREPRSALSEIALMHHAGVLARIRLTRTAAERGPVLSGERGQWNGFQTVHARVLRVRAPTVSTGSSVSGV